MTTITSPGAWTSRTEFKGVGLTCATKDGWSNEKRIERHTWNETRVGSENPFWKDEVRDGTQAGTDLTASKCSVSVLPGSGYVDHVYTTAPCGGTIRRSSYYGVPFRGIIASDFVVPALPTTAVRNKALAGFYEKARKAQRAFQGGVFAGELLETLRLIKSPLRTLRTSVDRHMNRLKRAYKSERDPKVLKRIAADTWLETSFGWKPLLSDVRDGLEYLERRTDLQSAYKRISYTETSEEFTSQTIVRQTVGSGIGTRFPFWESKRKTKYSTVRYLGSVRTRPAGSVSLDNALLGFAPSEFIPTAWELIPWSFLVDYFSNVGGYLSALTFHRADIAWVVETQRAFSYTDFGGSVDATGIRAVYTVPNTAYVKHAYTLGFVGIRASSIKRIAWQGLGIPNLEFHLPGSGLKWMNIVALMNGRDTNRRVPFYR
jgi:hypothetical protein